MDTDNDLTAIKAELARLKRDHRRMQRTIRYLVALTIMGLLAESATHTRHVFAASETQSVLPRDSVLRVRGIVVIDARGIERVVIGAPLPSPMFLGKRGLRQGPISGILMFDAMGTERNGYGTSDDADEMIFTMDNIAGQSALWTANPGTGVHLSTWDEKGNFARIGVYGKPMLYVEREGKRTFTAPDSVGAVP